MDEVKKRGVDENHILHYSFDSLQHDDIKTAKNMYEEIKKYLASDGKTYLFLDEVQEVESWEKVINSFMADFVAIKQGNKLYIQVSHMIGSEETEKREYGRLLDIHDNYPKYVLCADEFAGGNYEGIKTMHIVDFLLSKEY